MAFKKSKRDQGAPENPIELFRSLPRREYPTEMPHQRAIIEAYVSEAQGKPDVALQLPTGSGKTLVGLLIAEWRRRKNKERVVFLCPTKQLVNQAAEQAANKYGLDVVSFTGSKRNYSQSDVAEYRQGQKVAITTYSSLFNTNPFFNDADVIIIDDAHAAENYVGKLWSIELTTDEKDHRSLHSAISNILKPYIGSLDFSILNGDTRALSDASWVDKIPTPTFNVIKDELISVIDEHAEDAGVNFEWSILRSHLDACHLYISYKGILLRPIIPPTWSLPAFENATQRIYMSATLGEGGDLERLTGREEIHRLPAPEGFDLQAVGRRFFMFPGMSMDPENSDELRLQLMERAGRTVILTPSKRVSKSIRRLVEEKLKIDVFTAEDIEESKQDFLKEENAAAVLAGRYDGIDFPKDECRFLCIDDLPKATNAQERFLEMKMGAEVLLNDRIQTRVLQAVGRCTRSLQDYSAIYITGMELQDYLSDPKRRKFLYPEFQAELEFGVEQSMNVDGSDFLENFDLFLENGDDWQDVNEEILTRTKELKKEPFPYMEELSHAVKHEIRYQKAIWKGDFVSACDAAKDVLNELKSSDLRGYRALWFYLSGGAAQLAALSGIERMQVIANEQFANAGKAAKQLTWATKLIVPTDTGSDEETRNNAIGTQVENLERVLLKMGVSQNRNFAKKEKVVLEGLENSDKFEPAQVELGNLLGFHAGNDESDAAPDPWWLCSKQGIVFEDHAGAKDSSVLGAEKARQAAGHPLWLQDNVAAADGKKVVPVLVTPVSKAGIGAFPHLKSVALWPLPEYIEWAKSALAVVRELKATFPGRPDFSWRAEASEKLEANGLTMKALVEKRLECIAHDHLEKDSKKV